DGVIDRIRAVIARADPRCQLQNPKDRAVVDCRATFAQALILLTIVVDGKSLGRPDDASCRTRPRRNQVLHDLVDLDDGAPGCVMAGDDAAKLQSHYRPPQAQRAYPTRSSPRGRKICNNTRPCSCASDRSPISPPNPSPVRGSSIRAVATCRVSRQARMSSCGSADFCGNIPCGTILPSAGATASPCCTKAGAAAAPGTFTRPSGSATSSRSRCR